MAQLCQLCRTMALLPSILLIAGCDSLPQTWSRDDLEAIAANAAQDAAVDAAADHAAPLEGRIQNLESEISELKRENARLQAEIANITTH